MSFVHGKDTEVVGGAIDFSSYLNSSDTDPQIDMAETTTYGKEAKTYIPGLLDGTLTFAGFRDVTAEDELDAMIKSADGEVWTVAPSGLIVGGKARSALGRLQSFQESSPVGDVVSFGVTVQADGGLDIAEILHSIAAAESVTGQESSSDYGASTDNGGAAYLNLISFTGTSITVNVAHSVNDSTFVDIATFSALTAAGSERVIVAEGTTINRYLRAEWAGTFTSATFAVTFARR